MERLNVAVVGCGRFGEVHAEAYHRFGRARLLRVCDLDAERARKLAERCGCRWGSDVQEIADDPEVQAVSVATPDFAHREVCELLAAAGKHLLIEKPLATNLADAEAIAAAVDRAGVVGMVDFHNRYHPALRAVWGRVRSGQVGRPRVLLARLSDRIEVATKWFSWAARTGPEWFLGSHLVDVACWLMGQAPSRVYAQASRGVLSARGVECNDAMQIQLTFGDAIASLETSWILPPAWPMICEFTVSLQTDSARLDVDMNHQGVTAVGDDYDRPLLFGQTFVGEDEFGFFSFPVRDFVRSVLAGEPSPCPLSDGVRNVRILSAAVESARKNAPVELGHA